MSGNGNNGTLKGGTTWNENSLSFDGVNGWVSIGKINYENITLEVVTKYISHSINKENSIISNAQAGGFSSIKCIEL